MKKLLIVIIFIGNVVFANDQEPIGNRIFYSEISFQIAHCQCENAKKENAGFFAKLHLPHFYDKDDLDSGLKALNNCDVKEAKKIFRYQCNELNNYKACRILKKFYY